MENILCKVNFAGRQLLNSDIFIFNDELIH
jgi:hypothetical protein